MSWSPLPTAPAQARPSPAAIGWYLAVANIVAALIFNALMLARAFPPDQHIAIANLASPVVTLISAGIAFATSRHRSLPRRIRLGWLFFALAVLMSGLGSLVWVYYESVLQIYPTLSLADFGWLAFYPLMLAGVLCFPTAPRSRAEQTTFWLDALTVLIGGMLIGYFSLGPRLASAAEDWRCRS